MNKAGKNTSRKRALGRPCSFSEVLTPTIEFELEAGHPRLRVAGVDEVGRGCLAGPVVAAAAILPVTVDYEGFVWLRDVTDSKKLTAEARERLEPLLKSWLAGYAIGVASVEEIDRVNIHHASHLAMRRALDALSRESGSQAEHVLVDGNVVPKDWREPATAVVKGDFRCLSIAAASILAKVWRDRHMQELDRVHPGYGLAAHKGYPTPAHRAALSRLGASAIHRRSFTLFGDPGTES